jgi:hypothetical protein
MAVAIALLPGYGSGNRLVARLWQLCPGKKLPQPGNVRNLGATIGY